MRLGAEAYLWILALMVVCYGLGYVMAGII